MTRMHEQIHSMQCKHSRNAMQCNAFGLQAVIAEALAKHDAAVEDIAKNIQSQVGWIHQQ